MENLRELETLLSLEYRGREKKRKRYVVPVETWLCANEVLNDHWTTRLMKAVKDGLGDSVDFLLKCGADVNACDKMGRRAIEYSLEDNRPDMTLLLLQWDSNLPLAPEEGKHDPRIRSLMSEDSEIRSFLEARDGFHEMLVREDVDTLEKILRPHLESCEPPLRWVNSSGRSALFTAAKKMRCDAWALLTAYGFVCSSQEEEEDVAVNLLDDSFIDAIGNHFVELDGCHVHKMVARSRVYSNVESSEDGENFSDRVESYFLSLNVEEYTSDLLKCLQDDSNLEIIFDFTHRDIRCMLPLGKGGKILGMTDFILDRIYVTAMETKEFDHSDVVSNLAHELAHKALALVFCNGGLPYRKENIKAQEEYKRVVEAVLSPPRKNNCDVIICRAADNPLPANYELIVKVPEMISKYSDGTCGGVGLGRLKEQAPELLEFYNHYVLSEMRKYIQSNGTAGKFRKSAWLRTPSLLTKHYDERIMVSDSIQEPMISNHNRLRVLRVSNLKLGASHLKRHLSSPGDVIFIDWTRFHIERDMFVTSVRRKEIGILAILWDIENYGPTICSRSPCVDTSCIARCLEGVAGGAILVVLKKFPVPKILQDSFVDYAWDDLSDRTRSWLLGRKLLFCGKNARLGDICYSIHGTADVVKTILRPEEISSLIDEKQMYVGRPLEAILKEREFKLLRDHPDCFIPRSLRVRGLELKKGVLRRRQEDVFFVRKAKEDDLKEAGFHGVRIWEGGQVSDSVRCFILGRECDLGEEDHVFRRIFEELRQYNRSTSGRKWHFIHFFSFENKDFIHRCSLNCRIKSETYASMAGLGCPGDSLLDYGGNSKENEPLIIADAPGSGKSIFVNKVARDLKGKYKTCWVDVIELTLFEAELNKWTEAGLKCGDECLFELIKKGDTSLERNIFRLFSRDGNKFFVFFDGFDEICPKYKVTFISFLKALMGETNVRVCVTTRVHEYLDLEDHLSTLAYRFIPFSRAQQIEFLNLEWNASLRSLPHGDRKNRINGIISSLLSSFGYKNGMEGILELVESLKQLLQTVPCDVVRTVDFGPMAEELITKTVAGGKLDFTENPLHAWMLAYVVFEENFPLGDALSLSQLFGKFLSMKIKLYGKEKVRTEDSVAAEPYEAMFKASTYNLLKKFSAFYFLEDKHYELEEDEMLGMLKFGLIVKRNDTSVFVHRTFGEYLFSLWLLDKVKRTKLWLEDILLKPKYENVREFIDDLLLINLEKKDDINVLGKKLKIVPLSRSNFCIDELKGYIQKCLYMAILECRAGILRFLAWCSSGFLVDIIFRRTDWNIRCLEYQFSTEMDGEWNVFTFCGRCIQGKGKNRHFIYNIYNQEEEGVVESMAHEPRHTSLDYLMLLLNMLRLVEEYQLIPDLKQVITEDGMVWMGYNDDQLWTLEIGRIQFEALFAFLAKHREALVDALKRRFFSHECRKLLVNGAIFTFDSMVSFSESILGSSELTNLMFSERSFRDAWISVFLLGELGDVMKLCGFLEEKLPAEGQKIILLKRDARWRTPFFAACLNWDHPEVLPFVWSMCQRELTQEEYKENLFYSFNEAMDSTVFKPDLFLVWFIDTVRGGNLDGETATQLLLVKDEFGQQYLLIFRGIYSPELLYRFQRLLGDGNLGTADILDSMKGQYFWLAQSCFELENWNDIDREFTFLVEREVEEEIQPFLDSYTFVHPFCLDEEGYLNGVRDKYHRRVQGIVLKAFLVLLRGQVKLELESLGCERLIGRLKEECMWILKGFPSLSEIINGGDGERIERTKDAKGFLVPFFFGVLSEFLSREDVSNILLHSHDFNGTVFHSTAEEHDCLWSFGKCYDVARWAMGEDSLWRIHSARRKFSKMAVHQLLLTLQD